MVDLLGGGPGIFHERNGEAWCERVRLAEIADAVGTPCYVYSEGGLRRRYESFCAAFAGVPIRVHYSVKANHNLAVLRVLRELGAGVDVVSVGELRRARHAGFVGEDIVFGGVGKRRDELEAALASGVAMINVESESELRWLNEVAAERGVTAPVSVRVNPGVEAMTHAYTQTGHAESKFGVSLSDAEELYRLAAQLENIEPIGIDAHIGSQILDPLPYLATIERLALIVETVRSRGIVLRYLDIGGGFGLDYVECLDADLSPVAHALADVASRLDLRCILEPGRWLVAPAGLLLASVLYKKRQGSRTFYVTDTGSNDLVRPSYYGAFHPIESVRRAEPEIVADVVGPVCESGDFLGRDRLLPELQEGDLLAVGYVGAYGQVMSSNYNSRPRAAEVLVSGKDYRVVRRRETIEELWAAES